MSAWSRRSFAGVLGIGCVLALLLTAPVAAQDRAVHMTPVEQADDPELEPIDEQIRLSLDDAFVMALRRNLGLVVERYRRAQVLEGIREALGIYDLNVSGTVGATEENRPTSSTLELTDTLTSDATFFNFNFSQLTPWGGTAELDFNNSRSGSSNQAVQPNPQYSIDLDLVMTQPLLRDFGRLATDQSIILARTNAVINRQDFQNQVETVIQLVSDTYWDMVEAQEQLEVSQESLNLAQELHEMNRIQVEVGTMAPLEMVQSEAGVATREEEIIQRQAAVEDAADQLRRLINLNRGLLWDVTIVPTTDPEVPRIEIDLEEAIETALETRPDLVRQRLEIENRELEARVADNQTKPRLDLQGRWGYNEIDGDRIDFNTGEPIGSAGYFDTLDQLTGFDFRGWLLAVNFAYPIQNRAARARSVQTELAVAESVAVLRDLEQEVMTEVRAAARAVETAAKQIDSAQVSTRLAVKNLEAEQKRYENGLSTSFQVLEIQEDLSAARSREVSAVLAYRRALIGFYRSLGLLLEEIGVELADDDAGADG